MNETNTKRDFQEPPKSKPHHRVMQWAKTHRKLAIVVALVVIAAIAFGVWWFLRPDDKKDDLSSNPVIAAYQNQLPGLAEAVKNNQNDPKARQAYAVALYATGDVGQAKEQYEAQLKLTPDDATLRNNLGNVYRDLGDYEKAIASYQKSIELNKSQTHAYVNLANLYLYTLDKKDLAIKVYEDALRNNADSQDLMVLLGIAYEQSGDKTKARETFQKVLEKNSENAAAKEGLKRVQ